MVHLGHEVAVVVDSAIAQRCHPTGGLGPLSFDHDGPVIDNGRATQPEGRAVVVLALVVIYPAHDGDRLAFRDGAHQAGVARVHDKLGRPSVVHQFGAVL